jgi:DNA gyrase/topoisomerase IV subunit B
MPASVLKETTMDPAKRVLLRVSVSDFEKTDSVIERLMGKDAAARFQFIQEHSENFEVDI